MKKEKIFKILLTLVLFLNASSAFAADAKIHRDAALAACDAIVDLLDAGASAGTFKIFDGAAPTDCQAADAGTLLAELTLSDPAFGACADTNPGARATASAITSDSSANATGTAGYFRAYDSNGRCLIQGTVTATGGGGDLELNSVSISSGVQVDITSWVFNVPEY